VLAIAALALLVVRPALKMLASTKLDLAATATEEKRYEEARKRVDEAEWLDPGNPRGYQILAKIAGKEGQFALSSVLYSRTIAAAQARNAGAEDRNRVVVSLVDRAAVEIKRGYELQAEAQKKLPEDALKYIGARRRFENALDDMVVARHSKGADPREDLPTRIDHQIALAYLGLATVAQYVDEYPREFECLKRSKAATDAVLANSPKDEAAMTRLTIIKDREKTAMDEMAKFHSERKKIASTKMPEGNRKQTIPRSVAK
jgi:hypothetical protein